MRVRSDDAEIFYDVLGDGPAVVLLHAFPANHEMWLPAAELLATRYRVIVPDLRGHGASTVGEGIATMTKHAADVRSVLQDTDVDRAIFAGVSIGGYILFEIWRQMRDRARALILCNTKAQADTTDARAGRLKAAEDVERNGPDPFIDSMIPRLLGETTRTARPDLADRAKKMMSEATVQGIAAIQRGMAARPDSVDTLKTIDVPTLVIGGAEDVATPVADAQLLNKHIKSSELVVLPKAGHFAIFEQHEAAGTVIRKFLDRL